MRALALQEAEARPGERAPEQLPSRKLRVLDRPEAEIPGVVPAGTAGRTEHLLGMLRRPEQRRPATGAGSGRLCGGVRWNGMQACA